MSYQIDGPTQIGTTGQLNEILGNARLTNITSNPGDIVYANGSNNLTALAPVASSLLLMNPAGTAPTWLGPGTNGYALTMSAGAPVWASQSPEVSGYGFMAVKNGAQTGIINTPTVIAPWVTPPTASSGQYDTTSGGFNATTGVFTVPATPSAGTKKYNIEANISFTQTSNSSTGDHVASIRLNGAAILTRKLAPVNTNTRTNTITLSANIETVTGNTIDIVLSTDNGSTLSVVTGIETWFSLVLNANS